MHRSHGFHIDPKFSHRIDFTKTQQWESAAKTPDPFVTFDQSLCKQPGEFMPQAVTFYEEQLTDVDRLIRMAIEDDDAARNKSEILNSISGVGKFSTATVVSQLPELGQLNRG